MGGGIQPSSSPAGLACSQKRPRGWCPGNATFSSLAPPGKPSPAHLPSLSAACQQLRDGMLTSTSPHPTLPPCPPPCPLWLQEAVKLFLMSWHSAWLLLLEGKHLLACSARMLTKEKNHCPTQGCSREGQSPQPGAPLILTWTPVLSCPSESQLSLQ